MKYGLIMMGILLFSLSLFAQSSALPSPDRYPADSIIVMLREDTTANQFKAWVINRTDSTLMLKAFNREIEDWLEVKDGEGNWRVYNSNATVWVGCGMGLTYAFPLRRNDFVKVSLTPTPGTFKTLARARFTLDSVAYYSSEMAVSVDTTGFLDSDLRLINHALQSTPKDSSERRSRFQYYLGAHLVKKERYVEALEKFAEALKLDSTNYQVIISQGYLKIRQASKAKLDDSEISRILKDVFTSFQVIPSTEKNLQEKIRRGREAYARWLED